MLLAAAPLGTAHADVFASISAGVAVPWQGDTGYSVLGSLGGNVFSEHMRLEGEFEFRDTKSSVNLSGIGLGTIDIPLQTYDLRAVGRFVFRPGELSPYLGAGVGFKVLSADDRALKRAVGLPGSLASTRSYGVSWGMLGLIGLEWPLLPNFAVFAEARADYSWELTDGVSAIVDNADAGAFTGLAGLRYNF